MVGSRSSQDELDHREKRWQRMRKEVSRGSGIQQGPSGSSGEGDEESESAMEGGKGEGGEVVEDSEEVKLLRRVSSVNVLKAFDATKRRTCELLCSPFPLRGLPLCCD